MSDLHDARVEAAAKGLYEDPRLTFLAKWEVMSKLDPANAEKWRVEARRALAATDAVVTVEMIAEVLRRHQAFTHGDSCRCGWVATVGDSSHARHQAFEILALLRGGGDR